MDPSVPARLRSRDAVAAARTASWVMSAAALVVAGFALFDPLTVTPTQQVGSWVVVVLLAVGVAACRSTDPHRLDRAGVLLVVPALGVLAVSGLNLLTADTSAAAQSFLVLPTLWAAVQLRTAGAWTVALVAIGCNAGVVFRLEDPGPAVTDAVFVGCVLTVSTLLLSHAGDRTERLLAALRDQAAIDPLTGLVTRRVLDEAMAAALTATSVGTGTALVLVDVDSFKSVNDVHGHPVGDDALRHLALVLRDAVRHGDAVVSRMGGDELAVLLPGCTPDVAERRAADLVAAVRATPLPLPDGTLLPLTVSVGVAHAPRDAADLRPLYAAADGALYRAKRSGRDQMAVAGP